MALKVASRGRAVSPFIVMDVMRAAGQREAAGEQVLHLEVGQPGTPAPRKVLEAAKAALESDLIGYTDARGIASLRARIARHYQEQYGLSIDPDRVMVTTGSSGGFLLSFLSAFDSGDRVALAAPGYPAYRNILQALGVEAVLLPSELEHGFQPTVDLLERTPGRLDGLILASPSNPTGTMLDGGEIKALADYCAEQGIRLISDEIYHGISYGQTAVSALTYCPDAVIINSFSKYFSMTGWRLGWMILPEDLLRPAECLAQNLFISAPALSQIAGEAAFDCRDVLDGYVATYAQNRKLLLEELPKAGFSRLAPADGAFYIYADVADLTDDSEAYCRRMLAETGIAATPGVDFDPARGHHFVRFSFAGPGADIAEAARRLQAWV
ncbi:aminotransferase class I/II-fold pyridoxal phosphate-dependent enzyme [Pelagibius sp. Alg239-R121]|uniref:pyridoxal phosphate-dependent aminotransferase n=1 Tax=Pelagibius sp. Alg239-R121 TaxID=2993448 RepID=UPI002AC33D67|nr:aminotransferase class I/II-fold pyridoxal phosphate-dependent enzyme [Pelagibius sp. Alg239-R121]